MTEEAENKADNGEETSPEAETPINSHEEEQAQNPDEAAPEEPVEPDAAHWKDVAARNQAELDNYRKRMAREKAEQAKWANANLLGELLSVLDSFQMGLDAARLDDKDSVITQGMEMVQRQLDEFLTNQGVVEVPAIGERFDPNQHEAISHEHHPEVAEGVIISQVRRGFRLHDRLLRASNVLVSKGPEDVEAAATSEE
jgi:molecular chaperone GrpE